MSLIEREQDLSLIDGLVSDAGRGNGQVAVVTGPPGIGKTAFSGALRERTPTAFRNLNAIGGELDRELPFAVIRQLFEPALKSTTDTGRNELFSGAAGLAMPVFEPERGEQPSGLGDVVHGLYWLCSNLAEDAPLLITVDDIHWADEASLRFLSHLARRISDLPVLLVAACRDGELLRDLSARAFGGVNLKLITLAPLSPSAVSEVVRRQLGQEAEEGFCEACSEASGGNPFLLTEALASLHSDQVRPLAREAGRVRQVRSESVSRSVLSRVARSGPDVIRFARALAILGPAVPLRELAAFADLPGDVAATAADRLTRESIIAPDGPVRFVHQLVGQAVYGDINPLMRSNEHRRAARQFERDGADVERVAAQLMATAPEADPWTVATLRRAAGEALSRGAPESAVAFLTRASQEPAPTAERSLLAAELGHAFGMSGRPDEAARHLQAAIGSSASGIAQLGLALDRVFIMVRAGRGAEAAAAAELARQYVDWDDPGVPPALQGMLALTDFATMAPPSVWTSRLDKIAGQLGVSLDFDRTIWSMIAFGAAAMGDRSAEKVIRLALRAADGPVPTPDGWILVNMASTALAVCDRLPEALALLDRGVDDTRARGDASEYCYLSLLRSHTALYAGRLLEAEADARSALAQVAGEPPTRNTPLAAATLVDALVAGGRLDEASAVLTEYGLAGELPGDMLIAHFLPMARGALRLAEHQPADALRDFEQCGQLLMSGGYLNPSFAEWRAAAAAAHWALGHLAAATELAETNLHQARTFGAPRAIALALRTLSRAAPAKRRLDCLAEAVDLLKDSPAQLEQAHGLVDYGTALRHAGDRDAAVPNLRRGLELAAGCHAPSLARAARDELRLLGLRPRRPATTGRDALTASELRVARLAAEGATNREIAQTLFVTTRTIEVHLTNSYRKLGIERRSALSAALELPPDRL